MTNTLLARYTKSEFPSLSIGATEFGHLTVSYLFGPTELCISVSPSLGTSLGHRIGTTEILISVSPRIQKLPHLVQLGTTEIQFGVTEFDTLGVMVGFCVLPIYTPSPTSHSREKHSEHTLHCQIHFVEREPPTHVLRSRYSNPCI